MPTEIDPNMPPALQEAARKELAKVDASIARRNEIFARHPSPGVGGLGSTPQTDATALATAEGARRGDIGQRYGFGSAQYALGIDAPTEVLRARRDPNELIDNAIQQRRELLSQGIDPDRPAITPDRKRRSEMLHESLALGEAAHRDAATRAVATAQAYRQHKDTESSDQLSAMLPVLARVKSQPGTPEHEQELADIGTRFPLALQTRIGQDIFRTHTMSHDSAARTSKAVEDYRKATGLEPGSVETTATGGVNIRGKSPAEAKEKTIPASVIVKYADLQSKLAEHSVAAKADEQSLVNAGKKGTENRPYSKSAEWAAQEKEVALLEKHFPSLKGEPALAAASGEAKTLDADTAKKLLNEVGGDKEKARALAKERGFGL